jgi:hypothetical protein
VDTVIFKLEENKKEHPQHAIVCITGVLGDLELENKVTNLLSPLRDAEITFDIYIILSEDRKDSHFVPFREPYSFQKSAHFKGGVHQDSTNLTSLASIFYNYPLAGYSGGGGVTENPYVLNLTTTRFRNFNSSDHIERFLLSQKASQVHVIVYDPIINPPMNLDYIQALYNNDSGVGRRDEVERIVWRAVNDVRLLDNYDRCWRAISKSNYSSDKTLVIRAGEDSILDHPISLHNSIMPRLTSAKRQVDMIVSVPCKTVRGHDNDQIDFFYLSNAESYFTYPLRWFYSNNLFNNDNPNLESFLQLVYKRLDDKSFVIPK